jgi:hypothetical protein
MLEFEANMKSFSGNKAVLYKKKERESYQTCQWLGVVALDEPRA